MKLLIKHNDREAMEEDVFTTCASIFYDPGGPENPYPAQSNIITTIEGRFGAKTAITFTDFDLVLRVNLLNRGFVVQNLSRNLKVRV